ncbi:MAG: NAD(P)/FAD-dependent oxidoreductase [Leptonema sp. (in: bacteria)]
MQNFREKSFWLSLGEYSVSEPLRGEAKADVAIIGGGFTGLSTAYFLKKYEPSLNVTLLEGEVVGFGASGRNAGFSMTLFGFTLGITALRFGRQKALEAHKYMEKAVDLLQSLIREHNIDCDYEHNGFFRVATSKSFEKRIKKEIELAYSLGITGIEWIDEKTLKEQVNSPIYRGAWWEPRCGLLNPVKLARGFKKIIESMGVNIYENSPVIEIIRDNKFLLRTPLGIVQAKKIVLATNAYSLLIPQLKSKQIPVFTHIVLTEPLKEKDFKGIGWRNRQGIEDARNLVHYYRLTKDNRLLMGGRDITLTYGKNMEKDRNEKIFKKLEEDIQKTFPALKGIKITHQWGGPVSATLDFAPAIGFLGDARAIYSLGCLGHGVSLTHMNGWTIAELLLEKKTERTEIFFVNRKILPFPPEPLRFLISKTIKGFLSLEDRRFDPIYR